MDLKEILASQSLSEEQITAIETAMKENKIYTSAEENIDIRYNKLKEDQLFSKIFRNLKKKNKLRIMSFKKHRS